ncbi:transporter substrate-binding domain-containing protein [Pedobacter sp.]|uniref:transporter substrate-binding domain-containing protein n=1 Tax=Pedobacter sp. TaxID=1411316 RepID=UPI003BA9122E
MIKKLYLLLLIICIYTSHLRASTPDAKTQIKVGVYVSPPFVMKKDGRFTGMSIELWESLSKRLELSFEYQQVPTFKELVHGIEEGRFDVAVTNFTITQERARNIDFTQPWYDAGLRVMTTKDRSSSFKEIISGLGNAGHLTTFCWLAFLILLGTVVLTVFDRKYDKEFSKRWREGLAESFYHVMSIAISGKAERKNLFGWVGRIFSAIWLICGVAVVAYVTSSVTSVMTTQSLANQINSVNDLPGKNVGILTGSASERYAYETGLQTKSYNNIDQAAKALASKEIHAIVGDAPVLEYHQHTHSNDLLTVVGPLFKPDKYGFGVSKKSGLEKLLTIELLGAHEQGLISALRKKYFGE